MGDTNKTIQYLRRVLDVTDATKTSGIRRTVLLLKDPSNTNIRRPEMSISYLSLLLVLSPAWMGNGLPTEPKEPTSRDSRQMIFPIGVVPLQQPSNFFDYVQNLHPAVKHRLLEALVTATTALSENSPLSPLPLAPGYKAGTRPDNLNSLNLDSNFENLASDEEIFQKVSHLLPYSLEELRDMQSRLGINAVVTIIIRALLGQLVNIVLLPIIMSIFTGLIAG
ncbi:uncharacterized protein LOC123469982 isoform X2 [Daphnia magna]|uniref:uncharacterized protein LOC123469982 isoform X2 n=1 Tax=Daphnia magna TaxID=35525 RepID=UPI001E1BD083|nr:uncharacterized protein LOC123469982 isoform X2 [Daphnia magna]